MNSIEDALKFPVNSFTNLDGSINRSKIKRLDPAYQQTALNFIFICKAVEAHGMHYNYSRTKYSRMDRLVSIWCPDHQGYFQQTARVHLAGHGCPKCAHKVIPRITEYGTFNVPCSLFQYKVEEDKIIFFNKLNSKEFDLWL
ncbi:hypothetical protein P13BB106kb_p017 [Pectobacterium phage DU_PP_V]|uniref:Uncharacterized protein n=1 Tax=Pectobacterium phage DU_PP_V TaxID=2041492 RepID=A0A2D2W6S4_9CAUD|nr:hypothetical protein HOS40_gp017 [Pectobacterium phage DU_PP_V]ATS94001.1 hypothetical protein P13BB106kb_p017 [Pectobacterium phage DU_PP_V]